MNQDEISGERLFSIGKSLSGHISTMSMLCNKLDSLVCDYSNVVQVSAIQSQLNSAWQRFEQCFEKYTSLLDPTSAEFQAANLQFDTQNQRKQQYDNKIECFVNESTEYYNNAVAQELKDEGAQAVFTRPPKSPTGSVKSTSSRKSNFSSASRRLNEAKLNEAKAIMMHNQAVERSKRKLDMETKRMELEISQRQFELKQKFEIAALEAEDTVATARSHVELANLEAKILEEEINDNPADLGEENDKFPIRVPPTSQGLTPTSINTHPILAARSASCPVSANPVLPPVSYLSASCPVSSSQPTIMSSSAGVRYSLPQGVAVTASYHSMPTLMNNHPVYSNSVSPPVWSLPASCPVSPSRPLFVDTTPGIRYSPPVNPYVARDESRRMAEMPTAVHPPPVSTPQVNSENILAMMSMAIEKIGSSYDLPPVQIQKFDGSPENYPVFRERFKQLVESKPFDEATKMTRLLQFLEGPPLLAVKCYESVPGGLAKAVKVLQERFGRPCQIVRACVDSLIKGPAIPAGDKEELQRFADKAQVVYDTLESMGYLEEMNTDNLEKMILRLPKWAQTRFGEQLRKLECEGKAMPAFKDVVSYLKDRAYVANHPFFSKVSSDSVLSKSVNVKPKEKKPVQRTTLHTSVDKGSRSRSDVDQISDNNSNSQPCPACSSPHPLYRCDVFKSKSVQERCEIVKRNNICFNCIKSNRHTSRQCKSTFRCKQCGKPHHSLLHFSEPPTTSSVKQVPVISDKKPKSSELRPSEFPVSASCTATCNELCDIFLQILPIKVINQGGKIISTYALIDSGSDVTLIDSSLAKQLDIHGEQSDLVLNTVNCKEGQKGEKVNFKISSVESQCTDLVDVQSAWAIMDLTIPLGSSRIHQRVKNWPHLQSISFPEVQRKKISVLIGTNIQEAFIPLEVRKGNPNEPIAIKSCLGWSILGGSSGGKKGNEQFSLNNVSIEDISLSRQLDEFWKIESCGTRRSEGNLMSVEDHKAVKIIEDTICKSDGHYQMGMLWKDEKPHLPYNRKLAEIRLQHLKKRFLRDPDLKSMYSAVFDDYLLKGYARKLTEKEAERRSDITWYLPHHPVYNPNKPGKVRVVFDAAAKFGNTSLNDQLIQGPDVTNSLIGVLMRFRQEEIAFSADIEAMFLQCRVSPRDCDALRFLWWSGDVSEPPEDYQMLVHIFGAKSSPCCANSSLKKVAADNVDKYSPETISTVQRGFYVDDCLKSVPQTCVAIKLIQELMSLLNDGGFNLTKFVSNSREVLASIPSEKLSNPSLDLDLDNLPIERTLGMCWDAESDTFQFKVVMIDKPPTKRGILSIVSSLYDPLGFLSPFALLVKVLLQDLWRSDVQWDEDIQEPHLSMWNKWLQSLPLIADVKIPRCYKPFTFGDPVVIQVHHFSDASMTGYAAVSFLRMINSQGDIHCKFIVGKARNAPIRGWSIPRLELQAAVLSSRLHRVVRDELDFHVDEVFFWSDSTTTLQYIKNEKRRFKMFVSNRLTEIHEVSLPSQWRHVPGVLNPADDGSRGMQISSFGPKCRWWCGPDFLWQSQEQWPVTERVGQVPQDDEELQISKCVMTISAGSCLDLLLRRYSSWSRLQVLMAWLLRFVSFIKSRKSCASTQPIRLTEIRSSTLQIVRLVQCQYFSSELELLQKGQQVKGESKLANLSPILVDGVIRVGGRIRHAPVDFAVMHPVVLPKDHPVSSIIVRYYHEVLGHGGREHVLSVMRQRFWILRGRTLVRQVLRRCISCRKRNEAVMQQMMADLPKERLVPFEPPFTYTGIDLFGPFYVKRGRGSDKIYGCIFVCFNSRAIHIEDVSSLETDTFLQALRRFISNRGAPKEIWSDNGTNFTGADKEISKSIKEWNQGVIQRELHSKNVEWYCYPKSKWRFQPPTASHMSGVWERLIRSVRKSMKGVLGDVNAFINLETLRTVFSEVVTILNSRPLCPSSDDPNDLEPLTPSHLLLQRQNLSVPPGVFVQQDAYSRKQWRRSQFLANCIWQRWLQEYVPTLQQRQKWILNRRNLSVNDLVLLVDKNSPRGKWLLGRVTKVFPGQDSRVRSAEVKTKESILVRPVSKLCLLEEAS